LASAIMTDRKLIAESTKERYKLLIGKYVS